MMMRLNEKKGVCIDELTVGIRNVQLIQLQREIIFFSLFFGVLNFLLSIIWRMSLTFFLISHHFRIFLWRIHKAVVQDKRHKNVRM